MGSISSQTSLAGPYDGNASSWSSRALPSKKVARPRLPKIKSSPSNGPLANAKISHKRGSSASAAPVSPTFVPDYLLQSTGTVIPTAHADPPTAGVESKRSKAKIKPFLRKFASQEDVNSVDLSRSAADNEGLASVYHIDRAYPMRADSTSTHPYNSSYHHRTTSAASQVSTTTTSSRYVHPMRQTPRPYTPPVAASYKTSMESDTPITSQDDSATSTSYAPLPPTVPNNTSNRRKVPNMQIRTTGSGVSPRLTSSSQTNLPGTPSSLRLQHPTEFGSPVDMVSPVIGSGTARSSLESYTFRKSRSRSNTATTDPVQQAATVQALRQQFQAKEAAKDRKYAEAEARVAEREQRRKEKKEEDERRTSEKRERKLMRSRANSEKSSMSLARFATRDDSLQSKEMYGLPESDRYGSHASAQEAMMSKEGRKGSRSLPSGARAQIGSKGEKVQSSWALFWFRFKTACLRLKRKMSGGSR